LNAVIEAKRLGFYAKILPGISAEDCLIADLMIDTAISGIQSFEATDFLIYKRKFDSCCQLILWQPDVIGIIDHSLQDDCQQGIKYLVNYLGQYYNDDHEVVIYEAAQYPSFEPRIQRLPLKNLSEGTLLPVSTLYIPPAGRSLFDEAMARSLGMDISKLE
jgi:hypothetical protein